MTEPTDRFKFTSIAHAHHRYFSPLSAGRVQALTALVPLAAGDRVLDIGCGQARFLLDVLQAQPGRGVGVDANPAFVERARANVRAAGLDERVKLVCAPLMEAVTGDAEFAAILCMGSSQAIGTLRDAMLWAFDALRPGGVALFADGYWKMPPCAEYLDALGATADEMQTHAGNAALARAAGFHVLHTMTSNDDEWDEYEGLYCSAIERYVDAQPEDPDCAAMADRIRRWHDAYLRWGRATLGYGYYVLLKPSR
jgi:SAM-dependent methyltransferase